MLDTNATPRRRPKSEISRTAILKAAARLFVERSYAEVTMNDVAREALLTKGAVYHHFQSKEQVYAAMLHSELTAKGDQFAAALASGATCPESLRNLVSYFLSLAPGERRVMSLLRRDINLFTGSVRAELIRTYQRALPELVERTLAQGISRGELKRHDARLLSWQFVALVEAMLNGYASGLFSPEAQADYVVELFFCGVSAGRGNCSDPWRDLYGLARRIAERGSLESLVERSVQLLRRVKAEPEYTLVGGILRFETMAEMMQEELGCEVNVPAGDLPQYVAAIGAAVLGHQRLKSLASPETAGVA